MNPIIQNGYLIPQIIPAVLSNTQSTKWGVPSNSMMVTSKPSIHPTNVNGAIAQGAITSQQANNMGSTNMGSGTVGGWIINPISLTSPTGNIVLSSQGDYIQVGEYITLNGGVGQLVAKNAIISGVFAGASITGGSINIANGEFTVDSQGLLVAQNANISGAINATSGTIGGWTINASSLSGSGTINGGTITGSTITTSALTATGGSIGGLTVSGTLSIDNASTGTGFIRFQDAAGANDASILEDSNNNFIFRAGQNNQYYWQTYAGISNWLTLSSGNLYLSGGNYQVPEGYGIYWLVSGSTKGYIETDGNGNLTFQSSNNGFYFGNLTSNYFTVTGSGNGDFSGNLIVGGSLTSGNISGVNITASGGLNGASLAVTGQIQLNDLQIIKWVNGANYMASMYSDSSSHMFFEAGNNDFNFGNNTLNYFKLSHTGTWGGTLAQNAYGTGFNSATVLTTQVTGDVIVITDSTNTVYEIIDQGNVYIYADLSNGDAYPSGASANFYGSMKTWGTKSAVELVQNEARLMYSIESPEVLYADYGEDTVKNGTCKITFDPMFQEVTSVDYKIYITPYGKCSYIYAEKTSQVFFTVYCSDDIDFSWQVVKNRKHHENKRFSTFEEADVFTEENIQNIQESKKQWKEYRKNHPLPKL